jgi:hypothetical protein
MFNSYLNLEMVQANHVPPLPPRAPYSLSKYGDKIKRTVSLTPLLLSSSLSISARVLKSFFGCHELNMIHPFTNSPSDLVSFLPKVSQTFTSVTLQPFVTVGRFILDFSNNVEIVDVYFAHYKIYPYLRKVSNGAAITICC